MASSGLHIAAMQARKERRARLLLRGGGGTGTVKHLKLEMAGPDVMVHHVYYDIGEIAYGRTHPLNDTLILTSADRKYLLSPRYIAGAPIGIAEARVIGTLTDCAQMYHVAMGQYRVVTEGSYDCTTKYTQYSKIKSTVMGQTVKIGDMDSCHSTCIDIGQNQYRTEVKKLGTLPSVHPTLIREMVIRGGGRAHHSDTNKIEREKLDVELQVATIETRDQIAEIGREEDRDKEYVEYSGYSVATYIAVSIAVALALLIMCLYLRPRMCAWRAAAPVPDLRPPMQDAAPPVPPPRHHDGRHNSRPNSNYYPDNYGKFSNNNN